MYIEEAPFNVQANSSIRTTSYYGQDLQKDIYFSLEQIYKLFNFRKSKIISLKITLLLLTKNNSKDNCKLLYEVYFG